MKIKDKDEFVNLILANRSKFHSFGIKRLGLFGSMLRGDQTVKSDVDMIADFEKGQKTYKNFYRVAEYSEELFGRKVDLLTLKSLSKHIGPHIKKDLIYVQIGN